jgi:hypothetical protein
MGVPPAINIHSSNSRGRLTQDSLPSRKSKASQIVANHAGAQNQHRYRHDASR